MQSTIKFKGWPLLLAIILMMILQLTGPSQIWTMLFIGLGLLLLLSFAWARNLQDTLTMARERRYTIAQVGDRLEERFTITKRGLFPALWIEIVDHSTMPNYTASQVTGLGVHGSIRWHTETVCTRRGIFRLGPTEVNMGDPFGIFAVRQFYPNSVDFVIAPPIIPLPELQIASRGHAGEGTPRLYSLAPTEPTATVRPHTPADSLNRIHWPTTARRESLYVRGLQETTSGDWWLVLDMDGAVHSGIDQDSTLEKGILVAASLTERGIKSNQSVGLLTQGQESAWLPPKALAIQRWQILSVLARIEAGTLNLNDLLTRSSQLIKQNTSLIIITPTVDAQWFDPLLMLKRQGVVPTIIFICTDETRPTLAGLQQALAQQTIRTYLIDADSLIPPTPEELAGQWQWRTLGTGRVVAVYKPEGNWESI